MYVLDEVSWPFTWQFGSLFVGRGWYAVAGGNSMPSVLSRKKWYVHHLLPADVLGMLFAAVCCLSAAGKKDAN